MTPLKQHARNLFLLTALPIYLLVNSCNNSNGYVITGNVTGFPDSTVVYLTNLSTDEVFDSAMVLNNKFSLKGVLQDVPEQIWLNGTVNNQFVYTNLLIGNEKVNIIGDIKDFPHNVSITGSTTQNEYNLLHNLTKDFDEKRNQLVEEYFKLPEQQQQEKGTTIWNEIKILDDTTQALKISFVKENTNTFAAVITMGYLKNSLPKDTLANLYSKLNGAVKASKYAKVIAVFLSDKIAEVGDNYLDFLAQNRIGESVSFSNIIDNKKYVLLEFTSAYCGPCIDAAKELKIINKLYSDSVQIISFCTDVKKETWTNALSRDNVTWTSLWDGKGSYSECYIKYGVEGVPMFFIIDPKGKIIDKWSGYGKGLLEDKLKSLKNKTTTKELAHKPS